MCQLGSVGVYLWECRSIVVLMSQYNSVTSSLCAVGIFRNETTERADPLISETSCDQWIHVATSSIFFAFILTFSLPISQIKSPNHRHDPRSPPIHSGLRKSWTQNCARHDGWRRTAKNKRREEDTIRREGGGRWRGKDKVGKRSHSITLVTITHTVCKFPLCEC
jgi:hypothetical protein